MAGLLFLASAASAFANPPYVNEDADPAEPGAVEVYAFTQATRADDRFGGTLAGAEINYGLAPNLQVTTEFAEVFEPLPNGHRRSGMDATAVGFEYRFVDEREEDWQPQISIEPSIDLPHPFADRAMAGGHVGAFLPVRIQKSIGDWTGFGGVGYGIHPGAGNRNFWFAGWALTRRITSDLELGAEVYHQSANEVGGASATGFNFGATYGFAPHMQLLASIGRGLGHIHLTNQLSYCLGLEWTSAENGD